MDTLNVRKIPFKIIAGAVACVFLFQQISWAGDLIDSSLEQLDAEQSRLFAPAYLQDQQSAAEELVNLKQAIEDSIACQEPQNPVTGAALDEEEIILQGPGSIIQQSFVPEPSSTILEEDSGTGSEENAIAVVTAYGDEIYYEGGTIVSIKRADGTKLKNIVVNANNELIDAEIIFKDGTLQIVRGGVVSSIVQPDGTKINYEDGLVRSMLMSDGTSIWCDFVKDAEGNIVETVLTDEHKTAHYDSDSRLKKVDCAGGMVMEYENGIITKITAPGKTYLFEKRQFEESVKVWLRSVSFCDGTEAEFGEEGFLKSVTIRSDDGAKAQYDAIG
ncbi:MAG: hypothetical protein NC933_03465 [Candidatus Omnitrophica bacterium]|nr:hypothetical protein [Candidatus Omnitrophota bacterium]